MEQKWKSHMALKITDQCSFYKAVNCLVDIYLGNLVTLFYHIHKLVLKESEVCNDLIDKSEAYHTHHINVYHPIL